MIKTNCDGRDGVDNPPRRYYYLDMQQVIFTTDEKILTPLYNALSDRDVCGANFVLLENDKPIGFCRMEISEVVKIAEFKLLPDFDIEENKDFFFRTLLFKLSLNDYTVVIEKEDERLEKFGFKNGGGFMSVYSKDIVFPHTCGH